MSELEKAKISAYDKIATILSPNFNIPFEILSNPMQNDTVKIGLVKLEIELVKDKQRELFNELSLELTKLK